MRLTETLGNWELIINFKIFFIYFQSLLRTAEQLKIKGLCDVTETCEIEDSEQQTNTTIPPNKKRLRYFKTSDIQKDSNSPQKKSKNSEDKNKNDQPVVILEPHTNSEKLTQKKTIMTSLGVGMVSSIFFFYKI